MAMNNQSRKIPMSAHDNKGNSLTGLNSSSCKSELNLICNTSPKSEERFQNQVTTKYAVKTELIELLNKNQIK